MLNKATCNLFSHFLNSSGPAPPSSLTSYLLKYRKKHINIYNKLKRIMIHKYTYNYNVVIKKKSAL